MGERQKGKETIGRGDLFFLTHPGMEEYFAGYGLAVHPERKDVLVGVLMIDRPKPADPEWLREVENSFGGYHLVPMTDKGERGIVCQMVIEEESLGYLRTHSSEKAAAIKTALQPLLETPPKPTISLGWDEERKIWISKVPSFPKLPQEIQEIFEKFGYGCLAVESDVGVVHVCHAADDDINGFVNEPIIRADNLR